LFKLIVDITSGVTDGKAEGRIASLSGKLNVKTGPPLNLYFGFCILLVFSRLMLFCVFRSIFQWFRF